MRVALAGILLATLGGSAAAENFGVRYLYINRCTGNCIVHKGDDDARTMNTDGYFNQDPGGTQYSVTEWRHGDVAWNQLMTCLKEVYSPYDIEVSDVPPAPGVPFSMGIVAGSNIEVNSPGAGGYAALNSNCTPRAYGLSFTFANDYDGSSQNGIYDICAVVGQETAHSFGLRHSYEFLDGRSAGPDPMTYRFYVGQRFFRNEPARCGEFQPGQCGACGVTQNTHQHLTNFLGVGTPITPPPEITLTAPANGATIANEATVTATASAQRGVATVSLILNGYKWAEAKGSYAPNAQGFGVKLPPDVPDGVIDVVLRASDDIGESTDTPPITVTKGAPCTTADTCATGQRCDAGKCFWDAPVGVLGDECTYKQFCINEQCQGIDTGEQRCTQNCVLGISDSCPADFECLATGPTGGVCWPSDALDKGTCGCGSSGSPQAMLLALGLGALLVRRRRRS